MRAIIHSGFGGAIYAAGQPVQSMQISDNARTEAGGAASFIVHEVDGTSKFLLEDASGSLILEV